MGPTIGLASKVVFPCLSEMQTFYKPFSLKELGLDFKAAEQNRVIQAHNYWTKSMDNDTKGFNVHEIFSGYCSILSVLRALLPEKASKPSGSCCTDWHDSPSVPSLTGGVVFPLERFSMHLSCFLIKERITRY